MLTAFIVSSNSNTIQAQQTPTAQEHFERGVKLLETARLDEALAAFQESFRLNPNSYQAQTNIGLVLTRQKRHTEALEAFRQAVRLAPKEAKTSENLCSSLAVSKKYNEAVEVCRNAVKLAPRLENYGKLFEVLLLKSDVSEAAAVLSEAEAKFPRDENISASKARLLIAENDFVSAVKIYEELATANPKNLPYQVALAESYLVLERDAEAIEVARKVLVAEPQNPAARYFLGRVYFELGQNEEAIEEFKKVDAEDDLAFKAVYSRGLAEKRMSLEKEAAVSLEKAVRLAPNALDANREYGSVLLSLGRYNEAAEYARRAIAISGDKDFDARMLLQVALLEGGKWQESVQVGEENKRLFPAKLEHLQMFINVARSRQQGFQQVDEMRRYATENPKDLDVRLHLIQHLTYSQLLSESDKYIEEILALNPFDARVFNLIGSLRLQTQRLAEAQKMFETSLKIKQTPEAYLNLAFVHQKKGNFAEAVANYEKLFILRPDAPNILKGYGDFLQNNGKRREALEVYRRSLAIMPNNSTVLFNAAVLSVRLNERSAAETYLQTLKVIEPNLAKRLIRIMKAYR